MTPTWFLRWRTLGGPLVLNGLAALGAVLGLASAALSWLIFGRSADADIWLLSLAMGAALGQFSRLGVEQVAVFSADAHARSREGGGSFDRDAMTWALLCGAAFALLSLAALPQMVPWFASGYPHAAQVNVQVTVEPLLLQVAVAPAMLVLGQQLLLQGRARAAVLVGQLNGTVQCLALAGAWLAGAAAPAALALIVGSVSALVSIVILLRWGPAQVLRKAPDLRALWPFIRASVAMRATHSVHNFLLVLLTNRALSTGVEGTVAIFQYARRVSDGLISVAVGPHQAVYHASLAQAWVRGDQAGLRIHVRQYLGSAGPVLIVAVGVLALLFAALAKWSPVALQSLGDDGPLVLALLLGWQTLVAIESVPVGVLIVERRASWLLSVNLGFALSLWCVLHWLVHGPHGGVVVAFALLACQGVSAVLFALLAARLIRKHFGG